MTGPHAPPALLIDALEVGRILGLDADYANDEQKIRRAVLRLSREGGLIGVDGIGTTKKFYKPEVVAFIERRIERARSSNGEAPKN